MQNHSIPGHHVLVHPNQIWTFHVNKIAIQGPQMHKICGIKVCIFFELMDCFQLDWANSVPTYPQTGHHSRHRF